MPVTNASDPRLTYLGRSAVGVVRLSGRDRIDLLQRLSTNDVARLAVAGSVFSTVLTNEKGRIVDWLQVYTRPEALLLRTSPGRAARVCAWIDRYTVMDLVGCEDLSSAYGLVVAHGPDVEAVTGYGSPPAGTWVADQEALVCRGLAAFGPRLEILLPTAGIDALVANGQARGAQLAGPAVLDLLRLRAGVPSPEHEFHEEINPLELRLGQVAVSFNKGCYVGQEVIARIDSYDKLARVLMGFEADVPIDRDADPHFELRVEQDGRLLGRVTSWAVESPGGASLGLCVLQRADAVPGRVTIVAPGGVVPSRLVDRPFWSVR